VRMEAAVTKMFCSEQTIQFLNDAQIIFGGMGYETAASKQARDEPNFELEQLVRDATMYRIGEGATDVLRPFVAREALNFHLQRAEKVLEKGLNGKRLLDLLRFYVPWYVSLWRRQALDLEGLQRSSKMKRILIYIESRSRALARTTSYAMLLKHKAMQEDQGRQNRIEMIGESLFALAASALHAQNINKPYGWGLANEYFRTEKPRIKRLLREMLSNDDRQREKIGRQAVEGDFNALNEGVIKRGLKDYQQNIQNNKE